MQHVFSNRSGIGHVTIGQPAPDPDARLMADVEQIRALRAQGFEVDDIVRQSGMSYTCRGSVPAVSDYEATPPAPADARRQQATGH